MNAKVWLPLVLAVALGLIAALGAYQMAGSGGGSSDEVRHVEVVVAAEDIRPGDRLTEFDVKMLRIDADAAAPGAYFDVGSIIDHVALAPFAEGQVLIEEQLAGPDSGAGLQALVGEGRRAMTITVAEEIPLDDFILPESRIDLISTIRDGGDDDQPVSRAIVQNVRVIAVNSQTSYMAAEDALGDEDGSSQDMRDQTLTLDVSPEEATLIDLAYKIGAQPNLVLRTKGDELEISPEPITLAQLRGDEADPLGEFLTGGEEDPFSRNTSDAGFMNDPFAQQPVQPAPQSTRSITVIRGGVSTTIEVPIKQAEQPAAAEPQRPFWSYLLQNAKPAKKPEILAGDATGFDPIAE
jgi:Flp pilus assembly protein CpaB